MSISVVGKQEKSLRRVSSVGSQFRTAEEVHAQIKDNWYEPVWMNREQFDGAKVWAFSE